MAKTKSITLNIRGSNHIQNVGDFPLYLITLLRIKKRKKSNLINAFIKNDRKVRLKLEASENATLESSTTQKA